MSPSFVVVFVTVQLSCVCVPAFSVLLPLDESTRGVAPSAF
jgi:hypothetical protein